MRVIFQVKFYFPQNTNIFNFGMFLYIYIYYLTLIFDNLSVDNVRQFLVNNNWLIT